jgi:hypothetical protein
MCENSVDGVIDGALLLEDNTGQIKKDLIPFYLSNKS